MIKWDFMVLVSSLEVCCLHCSVQGFYHFWREVLGHCSLVKGVLPCNCAAQMKVWPPLNIEAGQQSVCGLVTARQCRRLPKPRKGNFPFSQGDFYSSLVQGKVGSLHKAVTFALLLPMYPPLQGEVLWHGIPDFYL